MLPSFETHHIYVYVYIRYQQPERCTVGSIEGPRPVVDTMEVSLIRIILFLFLEGCIIDSCNYILLQLHTFVALCFCICTRHPVAISYYYNSISAKGLVIYPS